MRKHPGVEILQGVQVWLFGPANASVVSGWSLLLTVFGFALTFWQLWRTRTAASAALEAAKAAKSRALGFDAAFEVARLASSLRETTRHVGNLNWSHSVDSLSEALTSLVRLNDLHESFDDAERQGLQEMVARLSELQNRITSSLTKGSQSVSGPKALQLLSRYQLSVTRLGTRFEKAVK